MPAPRNPLKAILSSGGTAFGAWAGMADISAAEIMARAGFDFLVLDNEHAPNDLRATRDQLVACEAGGTHAVVRVPVGETWMIKQMLDVGAQSILVPMVESAAQAEDLVKACRFPPFGKRGVGYALARASRFNATKDYGETADAEMCLIVQVENRAGLAALDDILAVDGVDAVFIGPADLAADMGHIADPMHPDVLAVVFDALPRIRAAGKAPGFLTSDEALIRRALEAGTQFMAVGADVLMLAETARAVASKWTDLDH